MPPALLFGGFFALFFGVGAFIVVASGRQRKRWLARPAILRALAARRGYAIVENPGKPSELTPIRPVEQGPNVEKMELPIAVRGRTLDGDFTLFDVYTRTVEKIPGRRSYHDAYETFITIKSDCQWPHFEFAAVAHPKGGSLTAALLEMAGAAMAALMSSRGLVRVAIPDRPGYELFVEPDQDATALRDALVPLFDSRGPWWVGGLGDALTLQRTDSKSIAQGHLVDEQKLDAFIDEAFAIERAARAAIRP